MASKNDERINLHDHNRLAVFGITEFRQDRKRRSTWTRIGSAFPNADGSLNVVLEFTPAAGQTLNIRPFRDRDGEENAQS